MADSARSFGRCESSSNLKSASGCTGYYAKHATANLKDFFREVSGQELRKLLIE